MQKHAALSRSVCSITPGFWDVTPRVISLISKPQARCVSDQLSFSPAVPNLPREPLTPPVVNRMDMVLAVLVEGKALLLMTLRSHGLRAHDRSPRLCGLNCKYGSVHKHCRGIITRAAGLMWNIDAGAAVLGLNGVVLMRGVKWIVLLWRWGVITINLMYSEGSTVMKVITRRSRSSSLLEKVVIRGL